MAFLIEFLEHSGHPVCTSPDPQAKAIIGCHSPFAPYPQSLQTRYTCFALPEVTRVGGNSLSVGCHCAAISGCTVATSYKDFSGTRRAFAACSTGTGDRGTPFSVLAVPAFRADKSDFTIAAADDFLRRYRIGCRMPHSSNAGTFLCYRATMPAIPPLEIFHGTTTPARLWMFSDFAIFTAVL